MVNLYFGRHSSPVILSNLRNMDIGGSLGEEFKNFVFSNASKNILGAPRKYSLLWNKELFKFDSHGAKSLEDQRYLLDVYTLIYLLPKIKDFLEGGENQSLLSKSFILNDHYMHLRVFVSADGRPSGYVLSEKEVLLLSRTHDWAMAYPVYV